MKEAMGGEEMKSNQTFNVNLQCKPSFSYWNPKANMINMIKNDAI